MQNFIGQREVLLEIKQLANAINMGENYNILILGNSGYGKTTLAKILAREAGVSYNLCIGDRISLNARVIVIDEVHLMKKFEILFDIMDRKEKTFIFLTTELGDLPEPMVNRCFKLYLKEYSEKELYEIAKYYCDKHMSDKLIKEVLDRSRGVPREIENLANRINLFIRSGEFIFNLDYLRSLLDTLGIYEGGFTYFDIQYLNLLKDLGGQASLHTICSGLHQSKETITKYIEPFLIKKRMIIITNKGRQLWEKQLQL